MIDEIAAFSSGDSSDPLNILHEYCASQDSNTKLRYGQYKAYCAKVGREPANEDAWYDLITQSQQYTFVEDVDVDGVYWKAKHVVF